MEGTEILGNKKSTIKNRKKEREERKIYVYVPSEKS